MSSEPPFYAPNLQQPLTRTPSPGFKLWELRQGDRVLTCELRDERAGAGVDVQLLEGGEILVSRRCMTGDGARYVAQSFKNDHLGMGWLDQSV